MTWLEGLTEVDGRYTERIAIREPVWNGRRIGVATFRAERADVIEVKVLYRLKLGSALIRQILRIDADKVLGYQRVPARGNPKIILCMVPIADMEVVN